MNFSPRQKLGLAAALLALLPLLASVQGFSVVNVARLLLALAAVGGLVWWSLRGSARRTRFEPPPRVSLVQRVGLSQRTGLALLEIDGQPWLVVHGDGFARLERASVRPQRRSPRVTDEVAALERAVASGGLS